MYTNACGILCARNNIEAARGGPRSMRSRAQASATAVGVVDALPINPVINKLQPSSKDAKDIPLF